MVSWQILTSLLSDSENLPDLFQRTQSSSVHAYLNCLYNANFFNDCSQPHCFSSSLYLHPEISEENTKAKMLNDSARITSLVNNRAGFERKEFVDNPALIGISCTFWPWSFIRHSFATRSLYRDRTQSGAQSHRSGAAWAPPSTALGQGAPDGLGILWP